MQRLLGGIVVLAALSAAAGCGSTSNAASGTGGGAGTSDARGGSGGAAAGAGGATGGSSGGGAGGGVGTLGAGGATGGSGGGGGSAAGTGGGPGCAFSATYTLYDFTSLVVRETETLTPPNSFHIDRQVLGAVDAGQRSCDPPLPDCNDPTRIDVVDVEAAIAHPDVQGALAMSPSPVYGSTAVADGFEFTFSRAGGRGFMALMDCNTPSPTCKPIPPGVNALVALLRELIRQQRMHAACSALGN